MRIHVTCVRKTARWARCSGTQRQLTSHILFIILHLFGSMAQFALNHGEVFLPKYCTRVTKICLYLNSTERNRYECNVDIVGCVGRGCCGTQIRNSRMFRYNFISQTLIFHFRESPLANDPGYLFKKRTYCRVWQNGLDSILYWCTLFVGANNGMLVIPWKCLPFGGIVGLKSGVNNDTSNLRSQHNEREVSIFSPPLLLRFPEILFATATYFLFETVNDVKRNAGEII